ncbi:hypothetical protein HELRODRAFT_184610 [Helobdella robusta]|uniref:Uncharacterized protein n=1 Tax=Helobdella robusta TaxID=6412 RepID=T1FLL0_HELRO|nr:hypothetical protein HELRODRAFT_184610 [Helobdella robusta]ESO08707.1 hypothetical protein HELRODRAFT_184610 [Helobdella robusta]
MFCMCLLEPKISTISIIDNSNLMKRLINEEKSLKNFIDELENNNKFDKNNNNYNNNNNNNYYDFNNIKINNNNNIDYDYDTDANDNVKKNSENDNLETNNDNNNNFETGDEMNNGNGHKNSNNFNNYDDNNERNKNMDDVSDIDTSEVKLAETKYSFEQIQRNIEFLKDARDIITTLREKLLAANN